jgi:3-dehydroquinate synthase
MKQEIIIESQQGAYPVLFFPTIDQALSDMDIDTKDYFVIVDENINQIYGRQISKLLNFPTFTVPANENSKTLEVVSTFTTWLISNGATKSSIILAIGGGIIQDIATFTAHIFKRGIKWEFLPTTLLSQSDSCIGAKCGINVPPYKNQIGVLQSPSQVVIVAEFLKTLDKSDHISGYGEILKLSLTPPNAFYEEFHESVTRYGFSLDVVLPILQKSLIAKKAIIEIDEYENDLRRILNYGHSFGHALEAVTNNFVPHGYGVIFGIDLINYLSTQWGGLDNELRLEIRDFIKENFPLDILPRKIAASELIEALKTDKKVTSGKINFAVLSSDRSLTVLPKSIDEELEVLVEKYLNDECIFTFN